MSAWSDPEADRKAAETLRAIGRIVVLTIAIFSILILLRFT